MTDQSGFITARGPESKIYRRLLTPREAGIGFVPYNPLGKGFLTGKIDESAVLARIDIRNTIPRFTQRLGRRTRPWSIYCIAQRKNATTARVALAWLLTQKPWIVPIAGTRKLERLDENIGAAAVELTPEDLRDIKSAASQATVQGARYPEHLEKLIDHRSSKKAFASVIVVSLTRSLLALDGCVMCRAGSRDGHHRGYRRYSVIAVPGRIKVRRKSISGQAYLI
jgi:hypothetical protein